MDELRQLPLPAEPEEASAGEASVGEAIRPRESAKNGGERMAANGNGHAPASLFWRSPLSSQGDVNWYVPPVPKRAGDDAPVHEMLDEFGTLLGDAHRQRAWLLRWNYRTRSAATAAELEDVEREAYHLLQERGEKAALDTRALDEEIQRLHGLQREIEKELAGARKEFARSAAAAGLTCVSESAPTSAPPRVSPWRRWFPRPTPSGPDPALGDAPTSAPEPEPIRAVSPQAVEEALRNSVPELTEIAGQHGVHPVQKHNPLWMDILSFLMQFFAPLVCGFMLALALGTLIGVLDLNDFQRDDSALKFALASALGFVIVYLMGDLFASGVGSLARALEMRRSSEPASESGGVPRHRGDVALAWLLIGAVCVFGIAEITAEGMGIRALYQQQQLKVQRYQANARATAPGNGAAPAPYPSKQELPLGVFLIIGTLISGPYLAYKAAKAWSEGEGRLREAWLLNRQREWLEARRERPEVQQAFHQAYIVEQIQNGLNTVKGQIRALAAQRLEVQDRVRREIADTQTRRTDARAAAIGEANRLQQMIEEIVDIREPLHAPNAFGDRAVTRSAPGAAPPAAGLGARLRAPFQTRS